MRSSSLWDLPNEIDAHGEDDRLLLRIDRSALTLFGHLAELGPGRAAPERLSAALRGRRLCITMLRQVDVLRTRIASPRLEQARHGLAKIERLLAREIAAAPIG